MIQTLQECLQYTEAYRSYKLHMVLALVGGIVFGICIAKLEDFWK